MKDLAGKIAFITGGASGIGFAMAQAFAREGMKVAIADVDEASLNARAQDLRDAGAQCASIQLDVRDRAAWQTAASACEAQLGPVNVLCNNAGVTSYTPLAETPAEQWDWVIAVNLTGVFNGIQTFAPRMIARKAGGHIVNTASTAGLYPMHNATVGAYVASKFGVVGMSERLRMELAPHEIGVSILCPGLVKTEIGPNTLKLRPGPPAPAPTPLQQELRAASRRYGMEPSKVADRVVRAIRDNEQYVITHPEFRPLIAERFETMLEAFGKSADPDLPLDPDWLSKT